MLSTSPNRESFLPRLPQSQSLWFSGSRDGRLLRCNRDRSLRCLSDNRSWEVPTPSTYNIYISFMPQGITFQPTLFSIFEYSMDRYRTTPHCLCVKLASDEPSSSGASSDKSASLSKVCTCILSTLPSFQTFHVSHFPLFELSLLVLGNGRTGSELSLSRRDACALLL